jgi:UDP-hydrolysing UDP-N-acetyl-D-glucosamine 2-epimerase
MKKIAVITGARSDYGLLRPVLRRILQRPDLQLQLIVTGMHLSPGFGLTVQMIEADGIPIAQRVDMLLTRDTPAATGQSMGLGTLLMADALHRLGPDLLLVLGDRFETFAGVAAALPLRIPVAHIHGGELTQGAMDESLRHAITKLSHLHFTATDEYRRRVIQMGELPDRVHCTGSPAVDNIADTPLLSAQDFAALVQRDWPRGFVLCTYHPVTLHADAAAREMSALTQALHAAHEQGLGVLITAPNADPGNAPILALWRQFVSEHARATLVDNLGSRNYLSAMLHARAMIGNSSSALIEAGSFQLPAVNIDDRQKGRARGPNVIDAPGSADDVRQGLARALGDAFRRSLEGSVNLYGDGRASERIVALLEAAPLDGSLILKPFHDMPASAR